MALIFQSGCMDAFAILFSIVVCIITYFKWSFAYWEKRKIPYLKPNIPWGTFDNVFWNPKSFGEGTTKQYLEAKQGGYKFIGLFGFSAPILMFLDPFIIKDSLSINFKSFMDRGMYFNEAEDPISAHLFAIEGVKWKNLRIKFTPTFTSGKIKMMFNILTECGDQLKSAMGNFCTKDVPVDIKDILERFTINVIGSAAFGIECNTFANEVSEFKKFGKQIFEPSKLQLLKGLITFANRNLASRLGLLVVPKDVSNFFMKVVRETVDYRENNHIERNDFMQSLINLKRGVHLDGHDDEEPQHKHDGKSLTLEELTAQAYVFFIAGYETSSTTMTFCLFELASNTEMQDKLRNEIETAYHSYGGNITYDAIHQMKYLGQVVDETLRKYPPLPILNRICTEDYRIPDTDIIVEKGTPLFIPVAALHHDSEYYPNPEKFDPERFSEENKHNIIPYTYLPFGEGPRNCIGLRFGLMQTKVGLTVLLRNFKFSLNRKTTIPLKMDPSSFVQSTLGGIWLNVENV